MTNDRATQHSDRDCRADPMQTRDEKQKRGNQFDHSRANPTPGLEADLGKDVNRFRGGGEFEEESLQQNDGRDAAAYQADGLIEFGMQDHKNFVIADSSPANGNPYTVNLARPDMQKQAVGPTAKTSQLVADRDHQPGYNARSTDNCEVTIFRIAARRAFAA
jgi:hypothetical protein